MVIGVKCADQLAANHIPVMFSKGNERGVALSFLYSFGEISRAQVSTFQR